VRCDVATTATAAFAVCALLAIAGASWGQPVLERVFKPLATLLLLPVLGWPAGATARWLALGICFSAAGDVALLWKSDRAFARGLGAFFAAHLAYLIGFAQAGHSSALAVAMTAAVTLSTSLSLRHLWPRIHGLRVPILAYAVALSAMVASAASAVARDLPLTWLALPGAVLFYVSDGCLAWNRFVRRIRAAPLLILSLYWLGQFGIASAGHAIDAGKRTCPLPPASR
jgi:alkenylglycerophosphocholine/alkenylglycerophosphoethanolamine hydrolase